MDECLHVYEYVHLTKLSFFSLLFVAAFSFTAESSTFVYFFENEFIPTTKCINNCTLRDPAKRVQKPSNHLMHI